MKFRFQYSWAYYLTELVDHRYSMSSRWWVLGNSRSFIYKSVQMSPLVLPIPFSHANIGVSWEMTPEWNREEGGWERGSERPRVHGWIIVWRVQGHKKTFIKVGILILDNELFNYLNENIHPEVNSTCAQNLYPCHLKGSRRASSLELEVVHIGRWEGKRAQIENAMRGAGTVVTQPFKTRDMSGTAVLACRRKGEYFVKWPQVAQVGVSLLQIFNGG